MRNGKGWFAPAGKTMLSGRPILRTYLLKIINRLMSTSVVLTIYGMPDLMRNIGMRKTRMILGVVYLS